MSRGFVGRVVGPLPTGSDGSLPDGAAGRVPAVPAPVPEGFAVDPLAGEEGFALVAPAGSVSAEPSPGGTGVEDTVGAAVVAAAVADPDVVVDDDVVFAGTGASAPSFFSSAEITPKVTPRPVSVAIAAVARAIAIGFFAFAGGGVLACPEGDDARRGRS